MKHSILLLERLSHFLVTIEETVNHDLDISEQEPLASIWDCQKIPQHAVETLRSIAPQRWDFNSEGEALRNDVPNIPGVYIRSRELPGDVLVIVGWFDNQGHDCFYHWEFFKA